MYFFKLVSVRDKPVKQLNSTELYSIKKKLNTQSINLVKFLSKVFVADADILSFIREENGNFIFTEKSARYNSIKTARKLYDLNIIEILKSKKDKNKGRGDLVYLANYNTLSLVGKEPNFDFNKIINNEKFIIDTLKIVKYVIFKIELMKNKNKTIDFYTDNYLNSKYFHLKFIDSEKKINNEYIFVDQYNLDETFYNFKANIKPYNDIYTVITSNKERIKEIQETVSKEIKGIVLDETFDLIYRRNGYNSKTYRPIIKSRKEFYK